MLPSRTQMNFRLLFLFLKKKNLNTLKNKIIFSFSFIVVKFKS